MSSVTPNYSLKKPAYTDFADVGELNDNMDVIDTALKAHDDILTTVPVANGGTGATTASAALTSLGAAADSNTVHKTGEETITGAKTFSGDVTIKSGVQYKYVRVRNGADNNIAALRINSGDSTKISSSQVAFVEYSPKSTPDTENTGYYESYSLPAATEGLAENVGFNILTTKNTITPAQGGTGQTSLQATRNAMGLGDTTGALPPANGGTGQTTLQATRNAMGLGNTTGALPVANGGTGATGASGARSNLGLGSVATMNTVPVTNGGTGATTAANARTNLGAAASTILNETNTSGTNNNISWEAYKSGKTVMLKFATGSGGLSSNVAQNTSFFTVTSGYRPATLAYFAVRYDTGFQVGTVGTDGTVKMPTSAAASGKGFYGTATYLTE